MLKSSALRRIVGAGLVAALAVLVGGSTLEQVRFGASDAAAIARVAAEIQERFDASADNLTLISARTIGQPDLIRVAARDAGAARTLFDVLDAALPDDQTHTGITVYGTGSTPLAWIGHVSETLDALDDRVPFVLAIGALGPRLVYVQSVTIPPSSRVGTIVVEQVLEPVRRSPSLSDRFVLSTSIAPVTLRVGAVTPTSASSVFHIVSRAGATLVDAEVSPRDIAEARLRWRRGTVAGALAILGTTLLGCAGWLVHLRRQSMTSRGNLLIATGVAGALIVSRAVLGSAATQLDSAMAFDDPLGLLSTSLVTAALVWLLIDLVEGRRLSRPRAPLLPSSAGGLVMLVYSLAGLLDAVLIAGYSQFLESIVFRTAVNLLHFSLHPVDITRLGLAFALVMLHASVIWTAVALVRLPRLWRRLPRGHLPHLAAIGWVAGASLGVIAGNVAWMPQVIALTVVALCVRALGGLRVRARRVSQSMRLAGLFLALVVPSIAMYPALSASAIQAKEELIGSEYGPQVTKLREDLQQRLAQALEQVDRSAGAPATRGSARRAGGQPRVHHLVANRARALPVDLGGRAVRQRRTARQPVRPVPARVRDDAVSRHELRVGCFRRRLSDRSERITRAACQPGHLRQRASGGRHYRPHDAGLPDAPVHFLAESVPRVAQTRACAAHRRSPWAGRRVRLLRMEPCSALCLRAPASGL